MKLTKILLGAALSSATVWGGFCASINDFFWGQLIPVALVKNCSSQEITIGVGTEYSHFGSKKIAPFQDTTFYAYASRVKDRALNLAIKDKDDDQEGPGFMFFVHPLSFEVGDIVEVHENHEVKIVKG